MVEKMRKETEIDFFPHLLNIFCKPALSQVRQGVPFFWGSALLPQAAESDLHCFCQPGWIVFMFPFSNMTVVRRKQCAPYTPVVSIP